MVRVPACIAHPRTGSPSASPAPVAGVARICWQLGECETRGPAGSRCARFAHEAIRDSAVDWLAWRFSVGVFRILTSGGGFAGCQSSVRCPIALMPPAPGRPALMAPHAADPRPPWWSAPARPARHGECVDLALSHAGTGRNARDRAGVWGDQGRRKRGSGDSRVQPCPRVADVSRRPQRAARTRTRRPDSLPANQAPLSRRYRPAPGQPLRDHPAVQRAVARPPGAATLRVERTGRVAAPRGRRRDQAPSGRTFPASAGMDLLHQMRDAASPAFWGSYRLPPAARDTARSGAP